MIEIREYRLKPSIDIPLGIRGQRSLSHTEKAGERISSAKFYWLLGTDAFLRRHQTLRPLRCPEMRPNISDISVFCALAGYDVVWWISCNALMLIVM